LELYLNFDIPYQPTDTTCGPTCLHAIYNYYQDDIQLTKLIDEVPSLEEGGTLAALLGIHALKRNYKASLYTYNLHIFDPTWFIEENVNIIEKLEHQMQYKKGVKFRVASMAYIEFLRSGGKLKFEDLTTNLIKKFLKKNIPILAGVSSTYLYNHMREYGENSISNDILGYPAGHFVVLCGYDPAKHEVMVADPLKPNPFSEGRVYKVHYERLICAILLGISTDDANLLILEPQSKH
jgi:hypothetical protein